MFDKEQYSKNRKDGKRGQGEYPTLVASGTRSLGKDKPLSSTAQNKKTKRYRKLHPAI